MRMKSIRRWGLMHNTETENIKEHSADTAYIAHALAVIGNRVYGKNLNTESIVFHALYHDVSEVITGDLATPIKYHNDDIKEAYKAIEASASAKIQSMLPEELKADYYCLEDPEDEYERKLVKAADKISAYFKCVGETASGNNEFSRAKETILARIKEYDLPEVEYFMNTFADSINLTLDELGDK